MPADPILIVDDNTAKPIDTRRLADQVRDFLSASQ
jgi:hypothetical protein